MAVIVGVVVFLVLAQFIDGRVAFFTGVGVTWSLPKWRRGERAVADHVGTLLAILAGLAAFFFLLTLFAEVNGWLILLGGLAVSWLVETAFASRRRFDRAVAEVLQRPS